MTPHLAGISLVVTLLLGLTSLTAAADTVAITARQAVVRAGPDSKQAVLTTVTQGTMFALLETRKGWYKVLLDDGREGWVAQAAAQVQDGRGLAVVPAGAAAASGRTALVIGNAAYSQDIGPLQNPTNDATDMAAALKTLGFTVTLLRDVDKQRMVEAVEAFSRQLRPNGVGLFYFAGHGAEGADGHNYLIPIGARLSRPIDIQYQGIAADWVLTRIEEAGEEAVTILILDACRNAPFRSLWRAAPSGFAPMYGAGGSLIAYATAPGRVADEGRGQRNGIYTKHLLRFITEPNLSISEMFIQVRLAVEAETGKKQIPWESSSLRTNFYFNAAPGGSTPTTTVVTPPRPAQPTTSSTSGTQVAVGVYPPQPQTPPATIVGNDGAEMVLVPAGEFIMGSDADELDRLKASRGELYGDEIPRHRVYLDAFYIDKYEVTNTRFQQFVQATGHRTHAEREGWGSAATATNKWEKVNGATWRAPHGPGSSIAGLEQHPVVQVSQEDAKAYCTWAGKRLPTEAEWEKAARGTDGRLYPWGSQFDGKQANFCDVNCQRDGQDKTANDGYRYTAPVGSYEGGKSPYGAYDMAGNVWEWVADWYDKDYYKNSPARNPRGPASGEQVVTRGGGWTTNALHVRAPSRVMQAPANRLVSLGFRCAKTL